MSGYQVKGLRQKSYAAATLTLALARSPTAARPCSLAAAALRQLSPPWQQLLHKRARARAHMLRARALCLPSPALPHTAAPLSRAAVAEQGGAIGASVIASPGGRVSWSRLSGSVRASLRRRSMVQRLQLPATRCKRAIEQPSPTSPASRGSAAGCGPQLRFRTHLKVFRALGLACLGGASPPRQISPFIRTKGGWRPPCWRAPTERLAPSRAAPFTKAYHPGSRVKPGGIAALDPG